MESFLQFKEWLTLEEAARYLSRTHDENITVKDIVGFMVHEDLQCSCLLFDEIGCEVTWQTIFPFENISSYNTWVAKRKNIDEDINQRYSVTGYYPSNVFAFRKPRIISGVFKLASSPPNTPLIQNYLLSLWRGEPMDTGTITGYYVKGSNDEIYHITSKFTACCLDHKLQAMLKTRHKRDLAKIKETAKEGFIPYAALVFNELSQESLAELAIGFRRLLTQFEQSPLSINHLAEAYFQEFTPSLLISLPPKEDLIVKTSELNDFIERRKKQAIKTYPSIRTPDVRDNLSLNNFIIKGSRDKDEIATAMKVAGELFIRQHRKKPNGAELRAFMIEKGKINALEIKKSTNSSLSIDGEEITKNNFNRRLKQYFKD